MTQSLLNVLYTPLETPPQPVFDLELLKNWISENYLLQTTDSRKGIDYIIKQYLTVDTKKVYEKIVNNYPWDLTVAYFNTGPSHCQVGWLGNFDTKFPDLSKFLYERFGIPLDEVGTIILLPIKENHTGLGFWHNDPDWFGHRFYLEYERPEENTLFLKSTKLPYTERFNFLSDDTAENHKKYLQDAIHQCRILSTKQSFFLNNVRAVHATNTVIPNLTRIAGFITPKHGRREQFISYSKDLIISSAEKYKDYSIYWNPES